MAKAKLSEHLQYAFFGRATPVGLNREDYLKRAKEFAVRGDRLPQTKLTPDDVKRIRAMADKRDRLRKMITDRYSNTAIAEIFGVHPKTIEKVLAYKTHI